MCVHGHKDPGGSLQGLKVPGGTQEPMEWGCVQDKREVARPGRLRLPASLTGAPASPLQQVAATWK